MHPPIVKDALRVIESHSFSRFHLNLLFGFVLESKDQKKTAEYVIQEGKHEGSLLRIALALQDLAECYLQTIPAAPVISKATEDAVISREGGRCCLTRNLPSWWFRNRISVRHIISPSLFASPRMEKGGDQAELLDMIFTESHMDEIRSTILGSCEGSSDTQNLWYTHRNAETAIRMGALSLSPRRSKRGEFPHQAVYRIFCSNALDIPRLVAADGTQINAPKGNEPHATFPTNCVAKPPNPVLVDFLKRFTILPFYVELERKRKRGGFSSWFDGWIPVPVALYRWIFRSLSDSLRNHIYAFLIRQGIKYYGPYGLSQHTTVRVPFGLYIKYGPALRIRNEESALKLIERETTISGPRHIDTLVNADGKYYMLMTRIPGMSLKSVLPTLSAEEIQTLRGDLVDVIAELRTVRNKFKYLICDTLGEGVCYSCWSGMSCGPFHTEDDFNTYVERRFSEEDKKEFGSLLPQGVTFTHGDLHGGNIIMLNGKLRGIIDWELAAWMPSYWEYCRMEHLMFLRPEGYLIRPEKIFGEDWSSMYSRQRVRWDVEG